MRLCSVAGCGKKHHAGGMCRAHYSKENERCTYPACKRWARSHFGRHRCVGHASREGRERYLKYTRDYVRRAYQESPDGYLRSKYRAMQARVRGKGQKRSRHLYRNLPIVGREEFLAWALADSNFQRLWRTWQAAGRPIALAPSIDRVDSDKGYTFDNMEFVTQSENSRRSHESPHRCR